MKKLVSISIVMVIFIGAFTTAANFLEEKHISLSSNELSREKWDIEIISSYPEINEHDEYVKIHIPETNSHLTSPGRPMLPYYSISTTFPFGTNILEVNCVHSPEKKIHLSKDVYNTPHLQYQGNDVCLDDISNMNFLNNKSPINECYSYRTGGGLEDGEHVTILSIRFYPVKYLSNERAINFIEKAEIEVIYETPFNPVEFGENYSLVMITPSSFSQQLQPLVNHKNKYGLSSKIVTLDEIYNGQYFPVEGIDNAEKIKYFIKNAIENWQTLYVLLVGDIYKLPIRYTWVGQHNIPTDLYYADVFFSDGSFSSWDTNENGRYGEYWQPSDDDVDLYPDVYIGRIACKNSIEVRNSVKKIIRYEESTFGEEWFNKILLCGGDTHPHGSVYEGEVMCDFIEDVMSDFTPKKLFTSDGTFSASAVNKALNNGFGFMVYSGHGFELNIGTHPPRSEEWIYYKSINLPGLYNYNKLPIIFFDACLTGGLDYTLGDLLKISFIKYPLSCIAWSFVKKVLGGAIATIGATRVAYSMVDENGPRAGCGYLNLHFFKNYEEGTSVSKMLVSSQNHYLNTIWEDPMTIEEFLLFGDPSLKVGGYNE